MFIIVILASLFVMLASLAGVISVWKQAGKLIEKNLSYLVSFSAGVFLIISYELLKETVEHSESIGQAFIWIVAGAIIVRIAFRFLPDFHHHHDEAENDEHSHSPLDARRILISDAIHNIGDGILLAAAFSVSITLGIVTMVSVFIHELVQEVSEFFVLRQAGLTTKNALRLNFVVSGTILIGALGGYLLIDQFEALEVPLLGIAAGSFLIVVIHDLIPHSVRTSHKTKRYTKHLLWFVIGTIIMAALQQIVVHSHNDEDQNPTEQYTEEELKVMRGEVELYR